MKSARREGRKRPETASIAPKSAPPETLQISHTGTVNLPAGSRLRTSQLSRGWQPFEVQHAAAAGPFTVHLQSHLQSSQDAIMWGRHVRPPTPFLPFPPPGHCLPAHCCPLSIRDDANDEDDKDGTDTNTSAHPVSQAQQRTGVWRAQLARSTASLAYERYELLQVLKWAMRVQSLTGLLMEVGFTPSRGAHPGFKLGVNATSWMHHVESGFPFQVKFSNVGVSPTHSDPVLNTMFRRLALLCDQPVIPVFVFDGPDSPRQHRCRALINGSIRHRRELQQLIAAFGFHWYTAPGDAVAELALLDAGGFVDAVVTDDVNAFLFGAQTVIRCWSAYINGDLVVVYKAKTITEDPLIQLTQGGAILFALLSGCEYDVRGVSGFGPQIALALSRYGHGETLLDAAQTMRRSELEAFLVGWCKELHEDLRDDPSGFLGAHHAPLADMVPDSFPNPDALLFYARPLTS
ncbi:hypothetical protein EW146_g8115 [Bondarzewia mesenterica]|uniref:XPG-I domain-containing protein n=1 Tax=Bondarzewia mesenterica TaxID=1095465 RepID=A0A4S4LHK2_9AGAM|nr:hypothetical protein EW146_g8115 [Bondarzewia mesenterica]